MNPFRSYPTRLVQGIFATLVALSVYQPLEASAQISATNLTGNSWKLVGLGSPNNPPLIGNNNITAQFERNENIVTGTGGCNFWGADYQTNGNTLQIGAKQFDSSAIGCSNEINNQEERYYDALAGALSYQINEQGQLKIFYQTNTESGVLIFEPQ
ncbi:MAG: META domain-containing protein [Stigonema ocellatum SAG 48.90 = DSM 106950]|nr:META domain-containing protein [Stigonema ocellatum SAG 48.90 = DSM 106950]